MNALLLALTLLATPDDPYPARLEVPVGADGTILFKAPAGIRKATLSAARKVVDAVLADADPEILDRLGRAGLEIAVAPRLSRFTDLPELRPIARARNAFGQSLDRARGVFLPADPPGRLSPLVAVGEEDILRLPPTPPQSHLRHELAHAVYHEGLTPEQRDAWVALYRRARAAGLFGRTYAATSVDEFFAELTEAYFNTTPYVLSRDQLVRIGPDLFAFLDRIYAPARVGPPRPWSTLPATRAP